MTRKRVLKRSVVSGFQLCLGILLSILSIWCMCESLNLNQDESKQIIAFDATRNIDYQVHLKDNQIFNVPYLNAGGRYVTSLIDHINMKIDYTFKANHKFDYTYQYRVVATATSKEKESQQEPVWSKSYILKTENSKPKQDSDQFTIQDEVVVPYQTYLNSMQEFQNKTSLKLNSILDIDIYVDVIGTNPEDKKQVVSNEVLNFQIPLSGETVTMTSNYEKQYHKSITEEIPIEKFRNKPLFIFSCLAFGCAIAVLAMAILEFIESSKEQFSYTKERNKILRKYDSIIVNARKIPSLKGKDIIEVTTIDELVDAEEELHIPIIYIEIVPGAVGWFIIANENQVWRYTLNGNRKNY